MEATCPLQRQHIAGRWPEFLCKGTCHTFSLEGEVAVCAMVGTDICVGSYVFL